MLPRGNIFFGVAFLILGAIMLLFNRMLAEEGAKIRGVFSYPVQLRVARVFVIVGGVLSVLLGILLFARVINWA